MKQLLIVFIPLILFSCATQSRIEPVGKDNIVANINIGGAIIPLFDTNIPLPYLTFGGSYGLKENLDLNSSIHLLPLAYEVAGFDAGASWYYTKNDDWIPVVGTHGKLMFFSSLKSDIDERFKFYPVLSQTAAWELWKGKFYVGLDCLIPFNKLDYTKEWNPLLGGFIGYKLNTSERSSVFLETKWSAFNISTENIVVDYISPGNQGAIGVFLSFERKF